MERWKGLCFRSSWFSSGYPNGSLAFVDFFQIHGFGVLTFPPSTLHYRGHWNSFLGIGHGWIDEEGVAEADRKHITWEFNSVFPTEVTEVVRALPTSR